MAVDSADKRYAMIGLGMDVGGLFPVPNGAIDTRVERLQYSNLYPLAALPISGAEFAFIVPDLLTDFRVKDVKTDFIVPDKSTDFEA